MNKNMRYARALALSLFVTFLTIDCFGAADSDAFTLCRQALKDSAVSTFEAYYDPSFLQKLSITLEQRRTTVDPNVNTTVIFRLSSFAHEVVSLGSQEMVDCMIERGLDVNKTQTVYIQTRGIIEESSADGEIQGEIHGFEGELSTSPLIETAVRAGNLSTLKALIIHGANPYAAHFNACVSWSELFLKEFVSDRYGATPLSVARALREKAVASDSEYEAIKYNEIIRLIESAQRQWDAKSRCSRFGCEIL